MTSVRTVPKVLRWREGLEWIIVKKWDSLILGPCRLEEVVNRLVELSTLGLTVSLAVQTNKGVGFQSYVKVVRDLRIAEGFKSGDRSSRPLKQHFRMECLPNGVTNIRV